MSRLAFVAPPFAGHLNPLVTLAKAALEAGHEVELLTGTAKIGTIRGAGVQAHGLAALVGDPLEAIADTSRRVGSNPVRLARQMHAAFAVMSGVRDELVQRWTRTPPDLVIADFIAVPAGVAADALGIPWITTLRAAFALEGHRGTPSYVGGLRPMPGPVGALRDRLGWLGIRWSKDALAALFNRDLRELGVRRRRTDGQEGIYSPRRILAFELAELEFPRDWPPTLRFIGPISENPEPPLELHLPPQGPRVLATLGTHLPWAKATLVRDVTTLAERIPHVAFLVSMGRPQDASPEPERVANNVFVYQFVPYRRYLPIMDAVIHHGGAGITGACIEAGRPALVWPRDFDQFDYAARIAHNRLGSRVRDLASSATAAALQQLLNQTPPGVERFRSIAARYDPVASFLTEVESITRLPR